MGNYEAEYKQKSVMLRFKEGRTIRSLADEYDISKASLSGKEITSDFFATKACDNTSVIQVNNGIIAFCRLQDRDM